MSATAITAPPKVRRISLRAVADALLPDNLKVREHGDNAGVSVETYLRSVGLGRGAPWCAAYVHYRLQEAATGLHLPLPADLPRSGYCPDWQEWGREHGWWVPVATAKQDPSVIRRGDQVLFYFRVKGRVAHTGLITDVHADGVSTVEGNTGSGSGVNRDGDGVYPRRRTWGEIGTKGGFVRLPF